MSDINSVRSYSDAGSVSDASSRPLSRLSVEQGDSSVHGSSVTSGTFRDEEQPSDSILQLRSFDQFDQNSERFDQDINASLSPEEERLMQEIERDQQADEDLDQDANTRAALLGSPLLMAASSEVVTLIDPDTSFIPQESATDPITISRMNYSIQDNDDYDDEDDLNSEYDSDLDAAINEEDLQFGSRESDSKPPLTEATAATRVYHDPFLSPEEVEANEEKARTERQRRIFFIVGWTIAIALIITLVVAFVTRRNSSRNVPTFPPRPTVAPTISPRPTISLRPTGIRTLNPTSDPTRPARTRSPSMQPIAITSSPTLQPTPAEQTPTPVAASTPPPTLTPSSAPTSAPLAATPAPNSFTLPPLALPTFAPTVEPGPIETVLPSVAPSFSDEESERRAGITEFVIAVSGVLILLDPTSPQFKAYQWVLNDDPLQLLATDTPQLPQRYYLATLYYATQGDNWDECGPPSGSTTCSGPLKRFLSGSPECMWLGITCDVEQTIAGINMRDNGMRGQLPPELGELSQLSTLSFSGNRLGGTIPTQLSRLGRLRFLLLNGNEYTGRIPTHLGDLGSIWYLHLGSNQFSGQIPSEIFTPSIQHFDLGDNALVGTIPPEIYTVSEDLLNIDISDNLLTGTLPSGLGDFPSLNSFSVKNNTLTGTLPGALVSDTLTTLDVGTNQLRGDIPAELYMFGTSLTFVNLGINNFVGTISTSFGDLQNLQTLVFFFNAMTGTVPAELGRLTNLEVLHFAGTTLQGTMPAAVCDLRAVRLQTLSSDCGGDNPIFDCSCCTFCFSTNRKNQRHLRATGNNSLSVKP